MSKPQLMLERWAQDQIGVTNPQGQTTILPSLEEQIGKDEAKKHAQAISRSAGIVKEES